MSAQIDTKQLEAEIEQLGQTLRAEIAASRRAVRTSFVVTSIVGTTILLFLLVNFVWFKSEMTPEKLTRGIERELTEVTPVAARELNSLGQELLPIYAAESQKQFQAAWPEMSKKLGDEVDELSANVLSDVHRALNQTEERVLAKTEQMVFAGYPCLNNPKQKEELETRLHQVCEDSVVKAITDFDKLFKKDVDAVQKSVLKFDLTDSHESSVDLQKKFIKLWLQLLDQEITKI